MTLDETRQLGIEFERRVQTMIPETEMISKLDTETIYSFLNQYQDKFIHDIYKALDNIPTPSKPSAYIENILKNLLGTFYSNNFTQNSNTLYTVTIPPTLQLGLYIESGTYVSDSYSYKNTNSRVGGYIPNTLISISKFNEFINRPFDSMRIMRQPVACFTEDKEIQVVHDKYTIPTAFSMKYYKIPQYMDLFNNKACELPIEAFDDIVSGAVDLYVQYVAGAEIRKRQMQEQQQKQNKKEDE